MCEASTLISVTVVLQPVVVMNLLPWDIGTVGYQSILSQGLPRSPQLPARMGRINSKVGWSQSALAGN